MRLNSDCVRNVLLAIEKYQPLDASISLSFLKKTPELSKYSENDLRFTLETLGRADLINIYFDYAREIYIKEITWDGLQFLDKIRSPKVWRKVEKTIKEVGTVSLPVLVNLATKAAEKILGM